MLNIISNVKNLYANIIYQIYLKTEFKKHILKTEFLNTYIFKNKLLKRK